MRRRAYNWHLAIRIERGDLRHSNRNSKSFDAFLNANGYVISAEEDKDHLAGLTPSEIVVSFNPTSSCLEPASNDSAPQSK